MWWAWGGEPPDKDGWTVEHLTPAVATDMLETYLNLVEDRREDPSLYTRPDEAEDDMNAMDEYAAVLRLTLLADPAEAARALRAERRSLARLDARWSWTYAALVRRPGRHRTTRPPMSPPGQKSAEVPLRSAECTH
ncbi:hypothetical protein [Streptomyces albus]|uniref:Uncharacterized protein n=1 Tax=Streptomyces albus TaxID=1888 RepID=A0A8H1L9I8_9ACTN|nr:hypothetical protein [Streptomyces albus]TGG78497.1 hypothetical protein D8771_25245 [Streptomyces albus]UVN59419.1 hypothetical protein NR995_33310 [Streptomyces albus]